ncbi:MAG: hypothetical protein HKO56_08210, partial [Bacteroidia bacterium]|nr:hypothetical protein [Bacteroidia bacterium]
MKSRFFNIIAICITVIVASGCASMQMRTADRFYEDLAYYNALRNYEDVAIKTQNEKAILRTAECYGLLNYNKEAEQWYSLAMEKSKVLPRHHFAYAKVLMKNGNYELAKKYLNKYLLIDRNNASIKQLISSCDSIEHFFYNDTTMYSINLLEWNELNSSSFSPRVHKSG